MLEKISNLRAKGEILKALIAISTDENELKEHKKTLNSVKNELLKMLDSLAPKAQKQEQGTARGLDEILADNGTQIS